MHQLSSLPGHGRDPRVGVGRRTILDVMCAAHRRSRLPNLNEVHECPCLAAIAGSAIPGLRCKHGRHSTCTGIYCWHVSGIYAAAMILDASNDTMLVHGSLCGARLSLVTFPMQLVVLVVMAAGGGGCSSTAVILPHRLCN